LCFAVLTLFAAHALLEYPHAYTYFLLPVGLLAGQLMAETGPWRSVPLPRLLPIGGAVVCAIVTAAVTHDYFAIEADTRELRAQKLRIGGLRTSAAPKDIWTLDQMQALAQANRIDVRVGMPPTEMAQLLTVARRFPTRYLLQQSVLALAANGHADSAASEVRRLNGMYGRHGSAPLLAELRLLAERQRLDLGAFFATVERSASLTVP
jgi:hypothetical protein